MSLPLPVDFTKDLYNETAYGAIALTADLPATFDPVLQRIGVVPATAVNGGALTAGAQGIGGVKTFSVCPQSLAAPANPEDLARKGYVDDLIARGLSWTDEVLAFRAMSSDPPVGPADGDRYISTETAGGYTDDYIYQWSAASSAWVEIVPTEGWATYIVGGALHADTTMVYNGTDWVNIGSSVNHGDLIGVPVGSLTHTTINSYLDQAVKVASTPQWTRVGIGGAADGAARLRIANGAQATTIDTDTNGYLNLNSSGNRVNVDVSDSLRVLATTGATSTTTGALIVSGGAGFAGNVYAQTVVSPTADLISAASFPLLNQWYRLRGPTTTANFWVRFHHVPYGRAQVHYYGYPTPTYALVVDYEDVIGNFAIRALVVRENTSGLYHFYVAATGSYVVAVESCHNAVLTITDCGPTSADPSDLPPGDYTIVRDSTQPYAYGAVVVGPMRAIGTTNQLSLNYDVPGTVASSLATDSNGYLNLNTTGNRVNVDVSDSLRVLATTAASSTTTGALIVSGGAGFAGDIYARSADFVNDGTQLTLLRTNLTDSCIFRVSAAGKLLINASGDVIELHSTDQVLVSNTTASTSTATGALVVAGGAGFGSGIHAAGATIISSTGPQFVVAYDGANSASMSISSGGILTLSQTSSSPMVIDADLTLGMGAGDYQRLALGGGNSSGFIYGSFPGLGDGIHAGYNYYYNAAGTGVCPNAAGATSRVSMGYGSVALATGAANTAPTDRLSVSTTAVSSALPTVITSTTAPQLSVRYDATYKADHSVDSSGNLTIAATNWAYTTANITFLYPSIYSAAATIRCSRMGNLVNISIPSFSAVVSGGSGNGFLTAADSSIPALYRPTNTVAVYAEVEDPANGAGGRTIGGAWVFSTGKIVVFSYFTSITTGYFSLIATQSAGLLQEITASYLV